jgi:hypothetical protein
MAVVQAQIAPQQDDLVSQVMQGLQLGDQMRQNSSARGQAAWKNINDAAAAQGVPLATFLADPKGNAYAKQQLGGILGSIQVGTDEKTGLPKTLNGLADNLVDNLANPGRMGVDQQKAWAQQQYASGLVVMNPQTGKFEAAPGATGKPQEQYFAGQAADFLNRFQGEMVPQQQQPQPQPQVQATPASFQTSGRPTAPSATSSAPASKEPEKPVRFTLVPAPSALTGQPGKAGVNTGWNVVGLDAKGQPIPTSGRQDVFASEEEAYNYGTKVLGAAYYKPGLLTTAAQKLIPQVSPPTTKPSAPAATAAPSRPGMTPIPAAQPKTQQFGLQGATASLGTVAAPTQGQPGRKIAAPSEAMQPQQSEADSFAQFMFQTGQLKQDPATLSPAYKEAFLRSAPTANPNSFKAWTAKSQPQGAPTAPQGASMQQPVSYTPSTQGQPQQPPEVLQTQREIATAASSAVSDIRKNSPELRQTLQQQLASTNPMLSGIFLNWDNQKYEKNQADIVKTLMEAGYAKSQAVTQADKIEVERIKAEVELMKTNSENFRALYTATAQSVAKYAPAYEKIIKDDAGDPKKMARDLENLHTTLLSSNPEYKSYMDTLALSSAALSGGKLKLGATTSTAKKENSFLGTGLFATMEDLFSSTSIYSGLTPMAGSAPAAQANPDVTAGNAVMSKWQ